MTNKPLTSRDVIILHNIMEAAGMGETVAFQPKGGSLQYGTARALVGDPETFDMVPAGMDIRDAYLWVSGGIVEYAWPIAEIMDVAMDGGFARNYVPMDRR
jgi:hypothetical protein